MSKITSKTITDVLEKLIGCTMPCGDSSRDSERLDNLKILIDVTNWCLDGLLQSADNRHSFEYSVRKNGELAFATMMEYKDWIMENLEDGAE